MTTHVPRSSAVGDPGRHQQHGVRLWRQVQICRLGVDGRHLAASNTDASQAQVLPSRLTRHVVEGDGVAAHRSDVHDRRRCVDGGVDRGVGGGVAGLVHGNGHEEVPFGGVGWLAEFCCELLRLPWMFALVSRPLANTVSCATMCPARTYGVWIFVL